MFTLRNVLLSLTAGAIATNAVGQAPRWLSSPYDEFLFAASSVQHSGGTALGGTTTSVIEVEHQTWASGGAPRWRPVLRAAQTRHVFAGGSSAEAVRIDGYAYPTVPSAYWNGRILIGGAVRQTSLRYATAATFTSPLHMAEAPTFVTRYWVGGVAADVRNAFTASALFQYTGARIQPGSVNDNDMTFDFSGQTALTCSASLDYGPGTSLSATLVPGSSSLNAHSAVAENAVFTDYDATMTAVQSATQMSESLLRGGMFPTILQIVSSRQSTSTVQRALDELLGRGWYLNG